MNEQSNTQSILSSIEIEASQAAQYSLIWLHGLGADGNDFVPIASELKFPNKANLRFIFPNAPVMPVTINNGYAMPAWFDIYALSLEMRIDDQGIGRSTAAIGKLIEREVERGIPTKHIFLAGFSQGATIALITGLCYPKPLAGIIALSGFLPPNSQAIQNTHAANQDTPIFLAHGTLDPVVPYPLGLATRANLSERGHSVDWHDYAMAHSVCGEEVKDVGEWLQKHCENDRNNKK
jgi:phospholipase/carboxylesterase